MGEVRVVDRASKNYELKKKEALYMSPDNNKFNRDIGVELPGCWLSMLRANHPPGYNKQYKHTLQKSCCLHCVIILQLRVLPQLTVEEDFSKKLKHRVKF